MPDRAAVIREAIDEWRREPVGRAAPIGWDGLAARIDRALSEHEAGSLAELEAEVRRLVLGAYRDDVGRLVAVQVAGGLLDPGDCPRIALLAEGNPNQE